MIKHILVIFIMAGLAIAQSYHAKMKSIDLYGDELMQLTAGDENSTKIEKMFFNKTMNEISSSLKAASVDVEINDGDLYIKDEKMRIDFIDDGKKSSFIIDSKSKNVMIINYDKKEYIQMNLDEMKAMQEKMQSMMSEKMKEMESMMKNMPPEARAQMEKMMKGQMPMDNTPSEKPKVSKTGKTKTINGFSCNEYIVEWSESKSQVWVTESYPVIRQALNRFLEISPKMQNSELDTWKEIPNGWPVMSIDIRNRNSMMGRGISMGANQFTSIEEKSVSDDIFKAPAGFEKTTMQEMMMN